MKQRISLLCAILSLSMLNLACAEADTDNLPPQPLYWELFGGGGAFSTGSISQTGSIFYPVLQGGALDIDATGNGSSSGVWMIGINMGYKWPEISTKNSGWLFGPAAEIEAYYLQGTQNATLDNQNPPNESDNRLVTPAEVNQFSATYPMHTGVFLLNAILSAHQKDSKIHPYIGAGIGAAVISIQGATANLTDPAVTDVNFYNSNQDATDWAFATQAKLGIDYTISENTSIFAEYRFLYLTSTSYAFGGANSDSYSSSSDWEVNMGGMTFNMGTIGIRYDA